MGFSSLRELRGRLQQEKDGLETVRSSIEALVDDLRGTETGREAPHYCIDYHDLRRYLRWRPEQKLDVPSSESDRVGDYVATLLFLSGTSQLLLLPAYYEEFRREVDCLLYDCQDAPSERALWLAGLRRELRFAMTDEGGLLRALEDATREGVSAKAALRVATEEVQRLFCHINAQLEAVSQAVTYLERFDILFRLGRLVGLRQLLDDPEEITFAQDKVYWSALGLFGSMRTQESKAAANRRDAEALSTLYQLAKYRNEARRRFFIVSSAYTMRRVVRLLNEGQLASAGERLELRDFVYWSLWFSALLRTERDLDRSPSFEEAEALWQTLERPLKDLERRFERLAESLGSDAEETVGLADPLSKKLELFSEELEEYLHQLSVFLSKVEEPIIDGRWLNAELKDTFLPVADESDAAAALKKLSNLLDRIRQPGEDLSILRSDIAVLHGHLETLLLSFEAAVVRRDAEFRRGAQEAFVGGFRLVDEPLDAEIAELLDELENRGVDATADVWERIAELRREGTRGFGLHVVIARAFLLEHRMKSARQELLGVASEERERPAVVLADAAVREAEGDLVGAERRIRSLLRRHPEDALVNLRLGELLARRSREIGSENLLAEALERLELASRAAGRLPYGMRVEVLVNYWRIAMDQSSFRTRKDWLEDVERQARSLVAEWPDRSERGRRLDMLEAVIGRAETLRSWLA